MKQVEFPRSVKVLLDAIEATKKALPPNTLETHILLANMEQSIEEMEQAVKLLQGVQGLIEDLDMSRYDGYSNLQEDAEDDDPDVKYAEGYEHATKHAIGKVRALATGTPP